MANAKKSTTTKKTSARAGAGRSGQTHPSPAPRRREVTAVFFFILAAFTFIGYFDSSGAFIGVFCGLIKGLSGPGFFVTPPAFLVCAVILCFHRGRPIRLRVVCTLLLPVLFGALWHLFSKTAEYEINIKMFSALWLDGKTLSSGGVLGGAAAESFNYLFSKAGAAIVFLCLFVFLSLSVANVTLPGILDRWRQRERREYTPEPEPERRVREPVRRDERKAPAQKNKKVIDIPIDGEDTGAEPVEFPEPQKERFFKSQPGVKTPDQLVSEYASGTDDKSLTEPVSGGDVQLDIPFMEKPGTKPPEPAEKSAAHAVEPEPVKKQAKREEEQFEPVVLDSGKDYTFPPLDLLEASPPGSQVDGSEEVRMNSERLETAFRSFGVNVHISSATRGPSVTRYEAELEAGVKLSKLTGLADDIALSLGASGVRIAAMPNKISTVGIEVPNKLISKVYLRDIIESPEFSHASSKLTFAIGKNISGEAVVGNVSKLPHMLVAGTTGSGKSVCLNSLILSILYKATPDDVRFIMIDPKMVEFRVYNSIPHLLVPVVTDVKKAAGALQWAVVEMMKRYRLFSETNARDLEGYNALARKKPVEMEPMPKIIVIIDELADLMLTAAKEVEESIVRVAQMGRAAGVHLVIATQSPRADVITGLMKANIPSRIALKVSSALESRIILDAGGSADKLVGNGDMLFAPTGTAKSVRVQGTWVSDEEREQVVEHIKRCGEAQYSEDVISEIEKAALSKPDEKDKSETDVENDYDELLPQAVDVIFESNQASVSMLQRRLKLGYSRAARIVDQMEQMGVVGPFEGSKPRSILITKEQWRQMQYINGTAPTDTHDPANDD